MTFVAFDELQKHFNNSLANVSSRMFRKGLGRFASRHSKAKGLHNPLGVGNVFYYF